MRASPREDLLAVEEPLEIQLGYDRKGWRVHKSVSITMRTPGADEDLALGFCLHRRHRRTAAQIDTIRGSREEANVVRVELKDGVAVDLRRLERHFYTTSSCGVCGKASIAALDLGPRARTSPPRRTRLRRRHDPRAFRPPCARPRRCSTRPAACTPAALFAVSGRLRRPSARTWAGTTPWTSSSARQLLGGTALPLADRLLFVSARAPASNWCRRRSPPGLPILAAVGAPSSLAVGLAAAHGMTLLGFVRGGRFNIYAGERRIQLQRRKAIPL